MVNLIHQLDFYFHDNPKVFDGILIGLFAIQILMFSASLIRNLIKKDGNLHVTLLSLVGILAPIFYLVHVYFLDSLKTEWSQVFYYASYECLIQQKWFSAMIYDKVSRGAKYKKDFDKIPENFVRNQKIKMYVGIAVILASGAFVFQFDPSAGPTNLAIAMYMISMAMILLLCIIMVQSLCRIKQYLCDHMTRKFDLKKCFAYALSYFLFLFCYVLFVVNAMYWKLQDSDMTSWLLICLLGTIVQCLLFWVLWNLAAPKEKL